MIAAGLQLWLKRMMNGAMCFTRQLNSHARTRRNTKTASIAAQPPVNWVSTPARSRHNTRQHMNTASAITA